MGFKRFNNIAILIRPRLPRRTRMPAISNSLKGLRSLPKKTRRMRRGMRRRKSLTLPNPSQRSRFFSESKSEIYLNVPVQMSSRSVYNEYLLPYCLSKYLLEIVKLTTNRTSMQCSMQHIASVTRMTSWSLILHICSEGIVAI